MAQAKTQINSQPQVNAGAYKASIFSSVPLPEGLIQATQQLEKELKMPVWLLLQDSHGEGTLTQLDDKVAQAFWASKAAMKPKTEIALVIDSPGGYARSAFQIATLLRRHCGGFVSVIPRYAKSAATLLTLGASEILLNRDAELGPLDAQIFDHEREEFSSALDEVQTLERLHAFALEAFDQTMMLLLNRTGKKTDILLPNALKFVADMMRPMFEKVDVVHFTQRARVLKVAEEYAIRLLRPKYPKDDAENIARRLVEKYPEHGFVINIEEAYNEEFGLDIKAPTDAQADIMDSMIPYLGKITVLGRIEETQP